MTTTAVDKLFVLRSLNDGRCQAFLSQEPGRGFVSALPVKNKGNDFAAVSSPDGKWIAFYSDRGGAVNLWISDSSGRQQRSLTSSDVSIRHFSALDTRPIQFSPDSQSVAFLQDENLWVARTVSEEPRALTVERGVEAYIWVPDGKGLVYLRRGSIRYVGLSGVPDNLLAGQSYNFPTLGFHPDPKKSELYYFSNGIWRMNIRTKKRERLYGSFRFPNRIESQSRTGESVALTTFSSEGRPEVYLVNIGKREGSRYQTSQVTQGGAESPFFSPDGKTLYFTREGSLWRCGLTGEKVSELINQPVFYPTAGMLETPASAECP